MTLTVPASFDAVARELTVRAATDAGLPHVTLLEEPQAAFYSWLERTPATRWRKQLAVGDVVLVCDVGGGTTDFSLIAVSEADGNLALERVAVGDHILLGGDNMDLALAHAVRARLEDEGHKLDHWQFASLAHACRSGQGDAVRRSRSAPVSGPRQRGSSAARCAPSFTPDVARVRRGFSPRCRRTRDRSVPRAAGLASSACRSRQTRPSRATWRPCLRASQSRRRSCSTAA